MVDDNKSQTEGDTNPAEAPVPPTNNIEDIDNLKVIAAIAYVGILFFVPMITHPKSEFAMFHANQGLLLLLAGIVVGTVGSIIPILGWFIIAPIGGIFTLVLFIMGLVGALQGSMKRLPLIGNFDLIKVEGK